jgi:histidine ammonia-lyase
MRRSDWQRVFDAAVAVGAHDRRRRQGIRTRRSTTASTPCAASAGSARSPPYRGWLHDSPLRQSHLHCEKVQDPYCLRCQPQVMGACLDQMRHAWDILLIEANGVSDNPLVFADTMERCRAATSTPSRSPSRPTTWRSPSPRSARCRSAAPRC